MLGIKFYEIRMLKKEWIKELSKNNLLILKKRAKMRLIQENFSQTLQVLESVRIYSPKKLLDNISLFLQF